jgi:hypothetical protein
VTTRTQKITAAKPKTTHQKEENVSEKDQFR